MFAQVRRIVFFFFAICILYLIIDFVMIRKCPPYENNEQVHILAVAADIAKVAESKHHYNDTIRTPAC